MDQAPSASIVRHRTVVGRGYGAVPKRRSSLDTMAAIDMRVTRLWALLFQWHRFPVLVLPPGTSVIARLQFADSPRWKPRTPRDALRMWWAERILPKGGPKPA